MKTAFWGNLFRSKSRPSVLLKFFIFNKFVRSTAIFVDLFAIFCFTFQGIAFVEAIVSKNNHAWSTSTDKSETGFLREKPGTVRRGRERSGRQNTASMMLLSLPRMGASETGLPRLHH